jgi:hypothetical protein
MSEAGVSHTVKASILLFACALVSSCSYLEREPTLQDTVSELNKKCPVMVDSETRLDRIAAEPGPALSYFYSLVNLDAHRVDTHQLRLALTPGLLSNIRVTEAMRPLREQQVIFSYHYADRRNRPILTIRFTPAHYR